MGGAKWIKLDVNIFEDKKMMYLKTLPSNDTLLVIWIKLLCLAGECNQGGYIIFKKNEKFSSKKLAKIIGKTHKKTQKALEIFKEIELIEIDEVGVFIKNFPKHQALDELEKYKKQNRDRQRKHREKHKKEISGVVEPEEENSPKQPNLDGVSDSENNVSNNVTNNVTCNGKITPCNGGDIEVDKDLEEEEGDQGGHYDPKVAELYRVYAEVFNQEPSYWQINELMEYCDNFVMDAEVLYLALRESKKNNAKSMKYVIKVLENWKNNQVKTVDDAKIVIREFENRQGGGKSDERRTPKKKSRNHEEIPEEECIYTKIRKQREQQEKENNISAD